MTCICAVSLSGHALVREGDDLKRGRETATALFPQDGELEGRQCICRRSALGRAFRWYIPGRFHTPVAPEEKARLHAEGKSFRES